ncbi:MAG: DUF368 domain-containing protein [Oscillospiraceae bacterium]|nr:DUF368 domain-containing protein [Oscillospiraceae bacterium]
MKLLKQLKSVVYGMIFGISNVIPGVSGGTMMVVFGCFDIVCGALALDIKHIKKHFAFLMLFAIGAAGGIIGFSFAVTGLLENFPIPTFLFFLGLVAGSLPLLFRKMFSGGGNVNNKVKFYHIIFAVIALAIVAVLGIAEKSAVETVSFMAQMGFIFYVKLFFCGFIAAVVMIIPGMSGSFMLMLFGVYYVIINAITELDLSILVPSGLGIIVGVVIGARFIKWLLGRFYTTAYSIITGLVIGSLFAIFPPGVRFDLTLLIGTAAFIAGAVFSFFAGREKTTNE